MSTQPFPAHRNRAQPVIERFEWLTALETGRDGTEHVRGPLRAFPRLSYAWEVLLPGDADKAALAALRTADDFLVPLWPHAFQRPDTAPTAGIAAASPQVFALSHLSEGLIYDATSFAWPADHYIAAPAARARFLEDTRSLGYVTPVVQTAQLAFRLIDFKESVAPYDGASIDGVFLLAPFAGYWTFPRESIATVKDQEDSGHVIVEVVRFKRRVVTLQLRFSTRDQVLAFRRLLYALQGRLNPLWWAAPGEDESLWRLDSDTVEIAYESPRLASCSLTISQPVEIAGD